ncbi:MAG: DUF5317 family protein [Dehalococcoidia bacterium]
MRTDRSSSAIRLLWTAPLAFACQLLVIHLLDGAALRVALPLSHLLLLPFLLANSRLLGVRLIALGLALNLLAITANGGLMPVEQSAVDAVGKHTNVELTAGQHIPGSKNILLERDSIHLRPLSDVILLPVPQPFTRAVSAGDLAIVAGVVAVLTTLVLSHRPEPHP